MSYVDDMIVSAPDQIENIENSIIEINNQITLLTMKIDSIQIEILDVAKANAIDIIENTILVDKGGDHVRYGVTFGITQYSPAGNLRSWSIRNIDDILIYDYTEGDYPDLDKLAGEFDFTNDYLTRPISANATYGLIPMRTNLYPIIDLLTTNKEKVENSVVIFEEYTDA